MERIEKIEFSEITLKPDLLKYIYAIVYIVCSISLSAYTFFSSLNENNKTCLYILSLFLLSSGIIFTLLRNNRKVVKSSGSFISYGKIKLTEENARTLDLSNEIRKITNVSPTDQFRISYIISQDRRFFVYQLQQYSTTDGLQAIMEPVILRNENAAAISSRLRINFTE